MTQVDICNRALAVIGHDRTISALSDTSTEGTLCARFYPAARDNVLAAYDWDFAAIETAVSLSGASSAWTIPTGFVKLVAVRDAEGHVLKATRSGASLVIANPSGDATTATVRYVSNTPATGTIEANYPHLVAEAVVYELASLLFGPVVGNVQDGQGNALFTAYVNLAGSKLSAAITAEQNEHAFMGGSRSASDEKKTEIVNRAIAHLGGESVVSDFATDPSPVAARARLLLPASIERTLRIKDWDFAAVELTASLTAPDADGFARYALPDDCARLIGAMDERRHPVECVRNRDFLLVRSEGGAVTLRYVSRDIDLADAPDHFVDLLALELADRLAATVLRDGKSVAAVQAALRARFGETDRNEANETAFAGSYKNPFVEARR